MSESPVPVSVYILDKEYRVACPEDEREELVASARLLGEKMRETRDEGKIIGLDRIAVITALNITHELLKAQQGTSGDMGSLEGRIQAMQDKIERQIQNYRQIDL